MKQIITILTILIAVSTARAEINISFDNSSGQIGTAMNVHRALDLDMPTPVLYPMLEYRDSGLSQVQSQGILLSLNATGWTTSSGHNYAFQWMPQRFKLVGGNTLLVEARTQAAGMTPNILIPVKITGNKFEYGPWNYSHCSPSMTFDSCFYKIRVQLEVVSDSVLQGTIYTQNPVDTGEASFVYYKKDSNKFPQTFAEFGNAQFSTQNMPQAKGTPQVNCWEDNCRMENVCGNIKSCNRNCQLLGGACGVAGRWITLYYTGGTQPTIAHGIGTFAGIGCNLTCKEWACDNITDCKPVKKCDTHCVTTSVNGDFVNVNTGQVIYQ